MIKAPAFDELTKFKTFKRTIDPHLQSQAKGILRVLARLYLAPLEHSLLSRSGVKYRYGLTSSTACKSLRFHHWKTIFAKPDGEIVVVRLWRTATGLKKFRG